MLKKNLSNPKKYLIALLAGLLTPLAYAPFDLFFISILSMAALLALWISTKSPKTAFRIGYCFGIGWFAAGIYWIYISIHQFGHIGIALSTLFTIIFIAYLSLYPAIAGYLLTRFFPDNLSSKFFCAFPVCWLLTSWVRSFFMTGFPWLLLGYSQTHTYLSGYATIFSVYGVSLAVLLSSALIVYGVLGDKQRRIVCLMLFLALWLIGFALSSIDWTKPTGKRLSVSLLQGDIPQSIKWSPDHVKLSLNRYTQLTQKNWHSQLIIWPETAIPLPSNLLLTYFENLNRDALKHKSSLLIGALVPAPDHKHYYNGLISIGQATGEYNKRRLVPFGESLPNITFLKKIYHALQLPAPGLTHGPLIQKPITAQGITVAPFICYEIAFPEQVRTFSQNTGFLLTVSDDAWFGHSIAPWQHLQMAQMRAIETGRMVLFDSNSGITAIINAKGNVVAMAPPYQVAVLHGSVQAMTGRTFWQHYGIDAFILLMLVLLVIAMKSRHTHRKRIKSD